MSVLSVQSPYPIFTDTDGDPLESGYIWIGVANLDPQVNPLAVYWDAALTMPAVQPIRTLAGYPSQAGAPGRIYTNADHSIRVQNKRGTIVFTAGNVRDRFSADLIGYVGPDGLQYTVQDLADSANVLKGDALIAVKSSLSGGVPRNQHDKNAECLSVKDFGAVGNGVDDDTAKIQSAVNAAITSGARLYIPSGNYLVSSGIYLSSNCHIFGDDVTSRIFGNNIHGILKTNDTSTVDNIVIENIYIDGMKTNGADGELSVCIYISHKTLDPSAKNSNIRISNCTFKNASAGIGIVSAKNVIVENNIISFMYHHTVAPYSGVYGYGVVLNGCVRSVIKNNIIGTSGLGRIQRHGIYLPVLRDTDVSPTYKYYCEEITIVGNIIEVTPDIDPFSSCIEAWNYYDFIIDSNQLIGGVRGLNSSPEYNNGSRISITNNIIKENHVCIRNGPDSFGNLTYFEEYTICNNLLMPLTSVTHQCLLLQGIKKIIFNNNYCRGNASSTFALGYYDTINNINCEILSVSGNIITGFTQGYYLSNVDVFSDGGTIFSNFTGSPKPYVLGLNVDYSTMNPVFSPYVELYQYTGADWIGAKYYSYSLKRNIICIGSIWVDETGLRVYGTPAQRPNMASSGNTDAETVIPYGFRYWDSGVGNVIYWNGYCWHTDQQPAPPKSGTTAELNTFKTNYPNAVTAYNIRSWNTTTSKPVFYNYYSGNWVYADGTNI